MLKIIDGKGFLGCGFNCADLRLLQVLHFFVQSILCCFHFSEFLLQFGVLLRELGLLGLTLPVFVLEDFVGLFKVLHACFELLALLGTCRGRLLKSRRCLETGLRLAGALLVRKLHFVDQVTLYQIELLLEGLCLLGEPLFSLLEFAVVHGFEVASSL